MDKIITLGFGDDFIEKLADLIHQEYSGTGADMSRVACVFGGRRPALFLRKALAQRIGRSFIPPRIFSMDSFMEYLLFRDQPFRQISELDACYRIYHIVRSKVPKFINSEESFNDFMPWAREILSFTEQLDIENISAKSLEHVQKSAAIGYDVPENINDLLRKIARIHLAFHKGLADDQLYTRGMIYLAAANRVSENIPNEFDKIIFGNFFYLHSTEQTVIKEIVKQDRGVCVFQGSQDDWPVLKSDAELLGQAIRFDSTQDAGRRTHNAQPTTPHLFHGSDLHAQVCLVREILKEIKDKDNTVIVVPRAETIIPLISEVAGQLDEYNISMGYSLKRSTLYALFELLYQVQKTRRPTPDAYYAPDYLNLLRHPLVKNLRIAKDNSVTRVVIHKLEESLRGMGKDDTAITGNIFLTLTEVEQDSELHKLASDTLNNMGIRASTDDCAGIFKALHKILFVDWSAIDTFGAFGRTLAEFLDILAEQSIIKTYSFNLKILERLHWIADGMRDCAFSAESFALTEIWDIFRRQMENEIVSFSGSPLRGTQILGLLETRALNFKNVIVLDANESILPRLRLQEPLIPREVMLTLGLNRLNKEEEIQRYYFKRLISGAENVYLVYEENREKAKSRFIEEIIWTEQKRLCQLDVFKPKQAGFRMEPRIMAPEIAKTPAMVEYLRKQTYSATRLNRYLECPLWFYYQYVLGLDEPENLLDDPDAANVGTFFHELFEEGFKRFKNRAPVIDGAFKEYLTKRMDEKFEAEIKPRMKADWFLLKMVMDTRLKQFLENEQARLPAVAGAKGVVKILELESNLYGDMEFSLGRDSESPRDESLDFGTIRFNYKIDRIDELADGSILVLDYKTGSVSSAHKPGGLRKLSNMELTRESILDCIKSVQLPLYNYFAAEKYPGKKVNSALYSLRDMKLASFISERDAESSGEIMDLCVKGIEHILKEILDPEMPFRPDKANERKCAYCPFTGLCG